MSYCRFQNTANDLSDCLDNITESLGKDEHRARARLVRLCHQIIESEDDIPEKSKD